MRRVVASLAVALAGSASAQTTDAFVGIPGVAFAYYDVSGDTPAAIRASIAANRVVDPHDGSRVDALSNWHYGWSGSQGRANGRCVVRDVAISFIATVRLPRLTGTPTPAVRAVWDRYLAAVERHEAGHVRYAYDHRGDVADAIRAAGCTRTDTAAKPAIARIDRWQLDYDRTTRHGETQGATIP